MKVEIWKTTIGKAGSVAVSELHELQLGKYNEFYLPSVDRHHELWVRVTDDDGTKTLLHLKR